jgi:hypothetical protein
MGSMRNFVRTMRNSVIGRRRPPSLAAVLGRNVAPERRLPIVSRVVGT